MLKILGKIGFITGAGILSVLIVCSIFFHEACQEVVPYRFYHVLTNSMEPTIKTNSLVLVKTYDDSMELQKDDIVVFTAERFGEPVVIMHRFSHTEVNEQGETIYKTRPEGSNAPDMYETKRDDLLGVYLCHIPYAGKFVLFLKSKFGLLWLCQVVVILLIKQLVLAKWEEKGKRAR